MLSIIREFDSLDPVNKREAKYSVDTLVIKTVQEDTVIQKCHFETLTEIDLLWVPFRCRSVEFYDPNSITGSTRHRYSPVRCMYQLSSVYRSKAQSIDRALIGISQRLREIMRGEPL